MVLDYSGRQVDAVITFVEYLLQYNVHYTQMHKYGFIYNGFSFGWRRRKDHQRWIKYLKHKYPGGLHLEYDGNDIVRIEDEIKIPIHETDLKQIPVPKAEIIEEGFSEGSTIGVAIILVIFAVFLGVFIGSQLNIYMR